MVSYLFSKLASGLADHEDRPAMAKKRSASKKAASSKKKPPPKLPTVDLTALEHEYRENLRPAFTRLSERLHGLLKDLLKDAGIDVAQLDHRVKDVDSFVGKVERKAYADPFAEIKDFCGFRIVTYYSDDVQKVADLLRKEFAVDPDHSTDKLGELAVDEFGYRSFHVVATLGDSRTGLPEWKVHANRSFEIQVRSVLQHAWAAISHKLDYKTASQAPEELRRKLFRLSALLELADDEFASIRN